MAQSRYGTVSLLPNTSSGLFVVNASPSRPLATTAVSCSYDFAFSEDAIEIESYRENSPPLLHPFYCWVAFILLTYQLRDICVTSSFGKLLAKNYKHLHTGICVNLSFHFSWLDFEMIIMVTGHMTLRSILLNVEAQNMTLLTTGAKL